LQNLPVWDPRAEESIDFPLQLFRLRRIYPSALFEAVDRAEADYKAAQRPGRGSLQKA